MCGNTTPAKSQRLPKNPANGQVPKWSSVLKAWVAANESGTGVNAYLYIAYADDANGNGFTSVFSPAKNYIAIKHTSEPIIPVVGDFTGLWFNYKGEKGDPGNNGNNGVNGADGADGKDGQSAFVYVGYADDENGEGFSEVFDPAKRFIAIRHTTWELDGQDPETFTGYWVKYQGDDGAAGQNGLNGQSAFVYIAYADNNTGAGFTTAFNPAKNFIAVRNSTVPLTPVQADFNGLWFNYKGNKGDTGDPGTNGADGQNGLNGQNAYVYIAYADDNTGAGFTTDFNPAKQYIAVRSSIAPLTPAQEDFAGLWFKYKGEPGLNGNPGADGANGANGQSAYVYIAYANDNGGSGFTTVFTGAQNFIAIKSSTVPLVPVQGDFAGLWFNYKGEPGTNGINGTNGLNGQSSYVYIAYADSNTGTGFTTVFSAAKNYVAIKSSTVPLTPLQSDFNGLWFNYKGQAGTNGADGINGTNGTNGQSAYLYIAYADDTDGNGFTTVFDANKNFIALFNTTDPIEVDQSTFDGLWVQYKGGSGDAGSVSLQRQDLSEDLTLNPIHNKYYLFNPAGALRKVYLDVPPVSIRFTIKNTEVQGGEGQISIEDVDETVIKVLTLGKSAQILFDQPANVWEVIEC